jgi:hypothetical protein
VRGGDNFPFAFFVIQTFVKRRLMIFPASEEASFVRGGL